MATKISDEAFIKAWEKAKCSPAAVATITGLGIRAVYKRRDRMVKKGVVLRSAPSTPGGEERSRHYGWSAPHIPFERRRQVEISSGVVVIFSDAHYWPGEPSLAHIALTRLVGELQPKIVVANGDILDLPTVSRFERPGYRYEPTIKEEIETVQERLSEVREAAPKAQVLRTLGNHCVRFERHLATHAPQYSDVPGTSLSDHIPDWPCSWTIAVNDDTIIRHRPVSGGVNSQYQSTLKAGVNYIHGHLHVMGARPYTDYRGLRFGVDTGTLADPDHDAFDYTEDGPKDWRSGFAVLTWHSGKLLWPEFCYVDQGKAWFRGKAIA